MNISDKLTAEQLYEIAEAIRRKGESLEYINVVHLIEEIKSQILCYCDANTKNIGA